MAINLYPSDNNSKYYIHDEELPFEFGISFSELTNNKLLPEHVRSKCNTSSLVRPILIYSNDENKYIIVKIGISEKEFCITNTSKCSIDYFTPGKGAGGISFSINDIDSSESLFGCYGYSEKNLEYCFRLQNILHEFINITIETKNCGPDC
jgi:hypothetical protein